ncbi:MAG: hypothetical protein PHQ23_06715 [Candidatus Wallbacteria bacterium]|nr:hypothetical protein [Candidatus Wallbacteria bacterium]
MKIALCVTIFFVSLALAQENNPSFPRPVPPVPPIPPLPPGASEGFDSLDANKDGRVTREEFEDRFRKNPQHSNPWQKANHPPGAPNVPAAGLQLPVRPEPGIYGHSIYYAVSTDGLEFASVGANNHSPVLEHASVPDALLQPDGSFWIYFVNGEPGKHGIWVAKPDDNGVYQKTAAISLPSFAGDIGESWGVDPDIVRLSDGSLQLTYLGNFVTGPQNPQKQSFSSIRAAFSRDGLNFTSAVELLKAPKAADPSLLVVKPDLWLLCMVGEGVLLSTSTDGKTFSPATATLPMPRIPELVLLPDGRIGLYIAESMGIVRFSSTDYTHWKFDGFVKIKDQPRRAEHPSVVYSNGKFHLFYLVVG